MTTRTPSRRTRKTATRESLPARPHRQPRSLSPAAAAPRRRHGAAAYEQPPRPCPAPVPSASPVPLKTVLIGILSASQHQRPAAPPVDDTAPATP